MIAQLKIEGSPTLPKLFEVQIFTQHLRNSKNKNEIINLCSGSPVNNNPS